MKVFGYRGIMVSYFLETPYGGYCSSPFGMLYSLS